MTSTHRNRLIGAMATVVLATLTLACSDEHPTVRTGEASATPVAATQPEPIAPVATVAPIESVDAEPAVPLEVTYADAETVYHSGKYSDATELFDTYVASHPDNGWGHYMLGLSAWKSGDDERAVEALQRVVELDSTNVKARTNLARVLLEQGRAEDALAQIEVARTLDAESNQVLRVAGNALSEMDRAEEALVAYREALVREPQDAWSMNNYALVLIRLGRFDDALPPLARAVELMPESALFQNNLGIALERTGDIAGAQLAFGAAVAADSTHARARISLERVAQRLDADMPPVADLPSLAVAFVEELERWATPPAPVVIGTPIPGGPPQD
ncbi:MAG: tetratricopeptide repeat protein [Longimicrobiales bacterium]